MRIYAIGDIHGQRAMLEDVHDLIARDTAAHGAADDLVVHLGDLVDRGPDSRGVIEVLLSGLDRGENWIAIRGNHDAVFEAFLTSDDESLYASPSGLPWENPRMGGGATLASYGVSTGPLRSRASIRAEARKTVPAAHLRFLRDMRNLYAAPGLIFVHAGIRPGVPITRQDAHDLHWIREPFLSDPRDYGALIVHGHTPVDWPDHRGNRLNLDTGAGMGRVPMAAVFEGGEVWVLTDGGRVPLAAS